MNPKDIHNKALDDLMEYKHYLGRQVQELKKLDQNSEFMRQWNKDTIAERQQEIAVIDKIIKSLIRF